MANIIYKVVRNKQLYNTLFQGEEPKKMNTNIYVGRLARTVTEDALKAAFEQFGEVISVKLIKDRLTGEARGFGFVQMPTAQAQQAIAKMNGTELEGQRIIVNEAREPEAGGGRPPRTGGFGGDRGGSRGGNGNGGWGRR